MPTAETQPTASPTSQSHALQCMEIVGGNQAVHSQISSPGLDIWLDSRPVGGHVGGDIHYFSMCGSGRVTRMAVADISGHGPNMDHVARWLRTLMRKYINLLDQTRFARAINRELTQAAKADYFATILLTTYFAPTDHLVVCNAGHPRPIWYSRRTGQWRLLDAELPDPGPSIRQAKGTYLLKPVSNLPLGIVEPTDYVQFAVPLHPAALVLIYPDARIEARNTADQPLGEDGLLDLARQVGPDRPAEFSGRLIDRVQQYRGNAPADDDQTLIVLHHNASNPPPMTVGQAVRTMAKMLGLAKV